MNTMKKLFLLAAAGAFAGCLVLTGCSGGQAKSDTAVEDAPPVTEPPTVTADWKVNQEILAVNLTEAEKTIFDSAAAKLTDMVYEPVAVIGSQVVAGMNYAYLCKAVPANAEPSWCIVTVYNDLEGNSEITTAKTIDLADIKTTTVEAGAEATGAWEVPNPNNGMIIPQDAQTAFAKAMEGYTGVAATPVALLGRQAAAGTNYMILCEGTTVTANPVNTLYVATVYEDLDGECLITSMNPLDLLYYVTP